MNTNSRLTVIHNNREFLSVMNRLSGRYLLLNAVFNEDHPEAIRLNVKKWKAEVPFQKASFRRVGSKPEVFSTSNIPFQIASPGILLTSKQMNSWRVNFSFVHRILGDIHLAEVSQADERNDSLLPQFQALAFQFMYVDSLLNQLPVETDLYHSYLGHSRALKFMDGNNLNNSGKQLLKQFSQAISIYTQIPELRDYFIQNSVREGNLGPNGQQFRESFQQGKRLEITDGCYLEYVGYELRPLRLTGTHFCWNQGQQDIRKVAVDLLCRYQGHPVWTELKMKGDSWTSSALQQILLYGTMLSGELQQNRCRRFFSDQFQNFRPWLAVLVEDRGEDRFMDDYKQAVAFAQHADSQDAIGQLFEGIIFGIVKRDNKEWSIIRSDIV